MRRYLIFLYVFILAGCGSGGGGDSPALVPLATGSFWAVDFTVNSYYVVNASEVGQGNFCHVYLESGQSVSQEAINAIIDQFDNAIHPGLTNAFGNEPDPGIDGDPKIYILLLNIRDGFTAGVSTSYIAGYFDPMNEYALSAQNSHSNQKEVLFLNINPAVRINPNGTNFFVTIAHELQHMIHWEQKTHQQGLHDDTWIDEAMAQVSRTYCGYGPDYASVFSYENDMNLDVNHSLVSFDETVGNYGMVYMWAQYIKDQFDQASLASTSHPVFWEMLHNPFTGISEVNNTLATIASTRNFSSSFEDWAMANFFGNRETIVEPTGNDAWSYTTIDTWGNHNGISLPGLFLRQNRATLQPLNQWSVGYYSYVPAPGNATGAVTWTRNASNTLAAFINETTVTYPVSPGVSYPFTTIGYLIYMNPSATSYLPAGSPVDTVTKTAMSPAVALSASLSPIPEAGSAPKPAKAPCEMLSAMNLDPTVRSLVRETGKPHGVHVDSWFKERERTLRAKGLRPPF
jgi:hypothetical protein